MKPEEWVDLTEEDGICNLSYVCPELSLAVAPFGWEEACRWASCHLGGMWLPNTRGCTWLQGRRSWRLCDAVALKPLEEARSITAESGCVAGWSIGANARALLASVTPGRRPARDELARVPLGDYAYHRSVPGYVPWARKIDCTSYYYSLMCRLPNWSPYVPSTGIVQFEREGPVGTEQRIKVCSLVAGHKTLRNALVGVAVGGSQGRPYYHRGERRVMKPFRSPWALLGHLVVRWGYDLCHEAAKSAGALWAHTDGLITMDRRDPSVWSDLGLTVRTITAGPTEVNHLLGFKCGLDQSAYYDVNGRYRETCDSGPITSPFLACEAMPFLGCGTTLDATAR